MAKETQQATETEVAPNNVQQTLKSEDPTQIITTVRMVVDGKEVGSIIGKRGDNVKRYRETSGSKINISDASCPERIVTITGMLAQIQIAFHLMCIKFEDDLRANTSPGSTLPPVNVRLVVPASQCGSLIGKEGAKIKELRAATGACVQVANDMLPGSTERVVTITGGATSISSCVKEICSIMLESPPKGSTIPYRPKPALQPPMMYGMTAAYGLPGQTPGIPGHGPSMPGPGAGLAGQPPLAVPPHLPGSMTSPVSSHPQMSSSEPQTTSNPVTVRPRQQQKEKPTIVFQAGRITAQQPSPVFSQAGMTYPPALAGLPGQGFGAVSQQGAPLILPPPATAGLNPYAILQQNLGYAGLNNLNTFMAAGGRQMPVVPGAPQQNQSAEMTIPNELIGCIIGRGGAKINEIRQVSGAQIKISNCEEGTNDRKVLISGLPDTVTMATCLINASVEIHRTQLLLASQEQANTSNSTALTPAATNLTPSSVSTPSNSQTQLTNSFITAVPTAQLQQLPRPATQISGTPPIGVLPYNVNPAALPQGYPLALPQYGLASTYDPKTVLAAANKLKMMPTPPAAVKQRYAPY